ncbi:Fluoroquinolones export ATP-binding protein Rv2688c/MT2762 [uncultured Eubacterium sp.]|nr:Fluoroquinolones export ATP-binding protein Rv2688c/MT2762 [uncultured Eubacterium sp.]
MSYAIRVEGLQKSYGSKEVLKGISFAVNSGEIFALLGINGAGKTTTLECIEGLKKYNGGNITVNGRCGVQLQSSSLPGNIKAGEALTLFSKWQKTKVNSDYVRRLGVEPFLQKQYTQLSTGQKRRLHLVLALLGNPDIVILDEPTAGLDVEGRVAIHREIRKLKEQGKTIILASHDMAEVGELCDRIGILKKGELAFLGTPSELTEMDRSRFLLKVSLSRPVLFEGTSDLQTETQEGCYYTFQTESLEDTLSHLIETIKKQGASIRDIHVERAGIEERFLEIAKEEPDESDAV